MSDYTHKKVSMDIKNLIKKYRWLVFVITFVVAIPAAFFIAEKLLSPTQSWYDDAWQYRKAITITNSGIDKNNYDVRLVIDTATLIADQKIQNDCDDIRFIYDNDTTPLQYYIEGGCNTDSTVIWVRVTNVSTTGRVIYMYYGNGSASSGSVVWSGHSIFFASGSCPAGTTTVSTMNGNFLYGSTTSGTGGASSHSHSALSCTSGTASSTVTVGNSGNGTLSTSSHTHTSLSSGSIASSSNLPPYLDMVLCSTTSSGTVPSGLISMFQNSVPASGWTRFSALDGKFPRANSSYGETGGADTYAHTFPGGVITGVASSSASANTFSLYDAFTTNLSTGNVNGTLADGSESTRTVVDSGNFLSLSSGSLGVTNAYDWGDPGIWYPSISRSAGRVIIAKVKANSTGIGPLLGLGSSIGGLSDAHGIYYNSVNWGSTTLGVFSTNGLNMPVGTMATGTDYELAIVLRSTGAYYFIKGGAYSTWTLVWPFASNNNATLFPTILNYSGALSSDYIYMPTYTWLPTPLAYDTFARSNGSLGSTETTGPDSQTTPALSWTGSTFSIASNVVTNTPSTGSQIHTQSNAASDPNGNEANATTGWVGFGGAVTVSSSSASPQTGTYSLYGITTTTGNGRMEYNSAATTGTWYKLNLWAKNGATGAGKIYTFSSTSPNFTTGPVLTSSYENYTLTYRATGTSPTVRIYPSGNSVGTGKDVYVDNVSIVPLTTSSLFSSVLTSKADVIADVNITGQASSTPAQAGLVLNLDSTSNPQNYRLVYLDGIGNLKVDDVVGGVYTNKLSSGVTYSAGATLRVITQGTKLSVYYNNSQIGSELTMTANTNVSHGIFSTDSVNTFDDFNLLPRNGNDLPSVPGTGNAVGSATHTHTTASGSTDSSSTLPPYLDMLFASADSNSSVDDNSVVIFDTLPMGWVYFSDLDAKFPRGSDTYGGTGGSSTHTHSVTISTGLSSSLVYAVDDGGGSSGSSTHTHSCSATTDSASNLPLYSNVYYAKRINNTADGIATSFGPETKNVPATPSSTGPQALTTNSIRWNFIDNSSNETGFKVYTDTDTQQVDCPGADISYCDESGLNPNTSYARKILAYNNNGNSDFSNVVTRSTLMPVPYLSMGSISTTSMTLNAIGLANLTSDSSGVYFDCLDSNCDTGLNSWLQTTSDTATGLLANTTYNFVAKARNSESVETSYSTTIQGTTLANTPTISSGSITSSSVDLTAGNTNNLTNNVSGVYFDCLDGGCDTGLNIWVQTANATATGLAPNTLYNFNVKARNANAVETANSFTLPVYSAANVPGTPTGNGLQSTSSVNVKVAINGNPSPTEFALYEETTAKYVNRTSGVLQASADWGTYSQWGSATGIDVVGLTSGTQYTFEVKARNGNNLETTFSNTLNLSTLLQTPTIQLGSRTSSSITWTISSVSGATSFELYDENGNLIQICGETCPETGLSPNTQYTRKVKAKNSVSNSNYSTSSSVYTLSTAATINSVTTDTDSAIINWSPNNPATTEFNIYDSVSNKYLDPATGLMSSSIVWGTYGDFNNISSEILGLSPYTHISLVITSRNSDNVIASGSNAFSTYVKANIPEELLLTDIGTTTVSLSIDRGSDPAVAQYLVYVLELDKYYDYNDGSLVSSATGLFTTYSNLTNINLTGLTPDTSYHVQVKARNQENIETSFTNGVFSLTSGQPVTTHAIDPGKIDTLSVPTSTSMQIRLNNSSNPSTVQFAVKSDATGLYINHSTLSPQSNPDWATYSNWGGSNGVVVQNLDVNSKYDFVAIAKNSVDVTTNQSSTFDSSYTLANTPSAPTVSQVSSNVNVVINTNGNPSLTKYKIYIQELNKYVNHSTGILQTAEDWGTYSNWGGVSGRTVSGLSSGTEYTLLVKARNQDLIETDYNSTNIAVSLNAPTIGTPSVIDNSTIRWTFTDNEDDEIGYRVFDTDGVQVSQCVGTDLTYCDEYGLSPNTSYTRKIAAYDSNGAGSFSSTATAVTNASVPSILNVTANSSTSLNIKVTTNSNSVPTQYEIQELVSGYFVNSSGQLVSGESWNTYSDLGGSSGINVNGLFANASYSFKVKARNSNNIETAYSTSVTRYTLAIAAGIPIVEADAPTSMLITVDNGGNTYNTEFAIKETINNKYIDNVSGSLTNVAKWVKISDLNNSSVRLSGLSANTKYTFTVLSRNGDDEVTNGAGSIDRYSLANIPNPLDISQINAKNLLLKVGDIRNPDGTQYAVLDKITNNFLNVGSGNLQSAEVWSTFSDIITSEGLVIKGLVSGKKYEFVVRARNGENIPTNYSTSSVSYTTPAISKLSDISAISTRALDIMVSKEGNDDSVVYSVYEEGAKKYVDILTGAFTDNPSWGSYSAWGGEGGFVIPGLNPSTDYSFKVNSKNIIDQESGLGGRLIGGTNSIIVNKPSSLVLVLSADKSVNPTTLSGSQRGLQKILAQINNFRVADIPILFSTDRDWSHVVINSIPSESKAVVKVHEEEGFTGKYTMYVVKNDSNRFILCTKAENIEDVNINCEGNVVFVGPYPQQIDINGNKVSVSIAILDGVSYWVVDGLSGTGGLGVKVEDDGVVKEPTDQTDNSSNNGGGTNTGGSNSGNIIDQGTANLTNTINTVIKQIQNIPSQTIKAIAGINAGLDNTVGKLPQEQLTVVTTTASVATVTIGLASLSGGVSSLPYYILELILGALAFLGFRKKGKPYGFVYDSVTKEPVTRAVVRIYNVHDKLVWTDVTDVFGMFNAKLEKGKYKVLVQKSGYKFPTQVISGLSDYPLEPIYHGEIVNIDSKKLFNVIIPIDKVGISKLIKLSIKTKTFIENIVKSLNTIIFLLGLILAVYTYNKYPSPLNLVFISVYIPTGVLILKNLLFTKKEWGKITDRSGKPIADIEVVLKDIEYGRYVGKRITEKDGLYRFIVSKGSYEILVVSEEYKVIKYEGGSNIVQIVKSDNEVISKSIIVTKKKLK